MKTFSGKNSEQYEAMKDALSKASRDFGYSGEFGIYDYLEKAPKTSLVVELVDALDQLGFKIIKK